VRSGKRGISEKSWETRSMRINGFRAQIETGVCYVIEKIQAVMLGTEFNTFHIHMKVVQFKLESLVNLKRVQEI